jgi:hypothetical protein
MPIRDWTCGSKAVGRFDRQIRRAISRELMGRPFVGHKRAIIVLPRKTSMAGCRATVPETDAGGQGEYPQALERTVIKELGKMTP